MQVFISFSSADRKIAEKIHDRLNKKGVDCWICTKDIPPGADYQACIVEAINACKVVVLVFSSNANLSPEIAKELSLASKKILIPARIEDVVPQGSFQYQLSNRQFVDLFDDFDEKLDELIGRIKSVVAAPGEAPPVETTRKTRKVRSSNGSMKIAVAAACVVALAAGGWLVKGKLAGPATGDAATSAAAAAPGAAVLGPVAQKVVTATPPAIPAAPAAAAPVSAAVAASVAASGAASMPPAAPAAGPSQLAAVLPLLTGTQGSERANALAKLNDRIPMNLDGSDADALVAEAQGYRASAIRAIAPHLAAQMGGAALARVLGDLAGSERSNTIALLAGSGKIKNPLTAQEAKQVLDGTQGYRLSGLRALLAQLPPAMGGSEAALVLQDIGGSERSNALAALAGAGKLHPTLAPDDARIVLDGTQGYRMAGLNAIIHNLAGGLDTKSLTMILGDISGSERLNALSALARANRIGKLQSSELDPVLAPAGGYRGQAAQVIAPFVH